MNTKIYHQGYRDYHLANECPYAINSLRSNEWNAGWAAAKTDDSVKSLNETVHSVKEEIAQEIEKLEDES
tara:strand:+ start:237 stop:446 length:210 start_codon:yes stop_codon:yes gene_type:complete